MTIERFEAFVKPLLDQVDQEGDALFYHFFSKESDEYTGGGKHIDIGAALMIIDHLAEEFNIDIEAVAAASAKNAKVVTPEEVKSPEFVAMQVSHSKFNNNEDVPT